uniref:Uncharacterized protein n=1 Tax=Oryza meridionalis TaxID=40149 RepID=A0A0E0EII9_9ORYZ
MQGIFACGSISSAHGSCFRPACLAVDDLRLFYKINSVTCGAYSWHWCVKKLHMRTNRRQMGTTVRTNARWLFGGDGRSSSNARMERSESANEDILIFYFQLDLQTRIQIETVIIRQREAKRGSSKTEAQDKAINLLRTESLAVSAKALAYQNVKYAFRLGQKVRHKLQKKILQRLKYQRNMISHVMKLLGMKMTMMAARIAERFTIEGNTHIVANP